MLISISPHRISSTSIYFYRCHIYIYYIWYTGFDSTVTVNCKNCEGTGKLASEPCPRCGGKRTLDGKITVTVNIEPGIQKKKLYTCPSSIPDTHSQKLVPCDIYYIKSLCIFTTQNHCKYFLHKSLYMYYIKSLYIFTT